MNKKEKRVEKIGDTGEERRERLGCLRKEKGVRRKGDTSKEKRERLGCQRTMREGEKRKEEKRNE